MKRWLCTILLGGGAWTGCVGAASVVEEVPPELRGTTALVPAVADRHPYADPSEVEIGRWASYREGSRTLTLAVVGREAEGTWVEVSSDGAASARLVAPDGSVLKAWFQEGAGPAREQALQQRADGGGPRLTEAARETGEEKVAVGGRTLDARRVRLRLEDIEGRLSNEVWVWHPDVPALYAGSELGGLVRRETGAGKVELLDFGAGRAAAVQRPP